MLEQIKEDIGESKNNRGLSSMPEKTVKKKHRVVRKHSVVDSAARNAASLTDGCNPEFVFWSRVRWCI